MSEPKLVTGDGALGLWGDVERAATRKDADRAIDEFVSEFEPKWPKAAAKLTKDREQLLAYDDFPAEHWSTYARRGRSPKPSFTHPNDPTMSTPTKQPNGTNLQPPLDTKVPFMDDKPGSEEVSVLNQA
jgi:hypothetical protein